MTSKTVAHRFQGRLDRPCEICKQPDRDKIHSNHWDKSHRLQGNKITLRWPVEGDKLESKEFENWQQACEFAQANLLQKLYVEVWYRDNGGIHFYRDFRPYNPEDIEPPQGFAWKGYIL